MICKSSIWIYAYDSYHTDLPEVVIMHGKTVCCLLGLSIFHDFLKSRDDLDLRIFFNNKNI